MFLNIFYSCTTDILHTFNVRLIFLCLRNVFIVLFLYFIFPTQNIYMTTFVLQRIYLVQDWDKEHFIQQHEPHCAPSFTWWLPFTRIWKTPAWVHFFYRKGRSLEPKSWLNDTTFFLLKRVGSVWFKHFLIYFQTVITMVIIIL